MPQTNTPLTELLSPEALVRIDNYSLLAKIAVEGFISGLHRSLNRGTGSEFRQYRNYTPGDDLRYLDWKALARRDRRYTKIYEEESNLKCLLVIDASGSMAYQGSQAACTKFKYASMAAAAVAYLANRQGDDVGLVCYNSQIQASMPPSHTTGHLERLLVHLYNVTPASNADHDRCMSLVADMISGRGLVVFFSDFLEAEERLGYHMKRLRALKQDALAFHVLDQDERQLPFNNSVTFVDSESNERILTAPDKIRNDYMSRMNDFVENVHKACTDAKVDYAGINTTQHLGEVLASYLHHRGQVY